MTSPFVCLKVLMNTAYPTTAAELMEHRVAFIVKEQEEATGK